MQLSNETPAASQVSRPVPCDVEQAICEPGVQTFWVQTPLLRVNPELQLTVVQIESPHVPAPTPFVTAQLIVVPAVHVLLSRATDAIGWLTGSKGLIFEQF
jgi:hypothetical protein